MGDGYVFYFVDDVFVFVYVCLLVFVRGGGGGLTTRSFG